MNERLIVAVAFLLMLGCANSPPPESPPATAKKTNCPRPDYPEAALKEGKEGTTRLKFDVDADGSVTGIKMLSSSGSDVLDSAARANLLSCHFTGPFSGADIRYVWTRPR